MSGIVALVPLRDGQSGKTRLAHRFTERERAMLIASMARHVVRTLLDSGAVATVLIVTHDPTFVHQNVHDGDDDVYILPQPNDVVGLNGALEYGRDWAIARDATGLLVVHADLPALQPDEVRQLVNAPAPLVLAPDLHRTGTNALALRLDGASGGRSLASDRFAFRFGAGSYAAHLAEAERMGLATTTAIMDGVERDLDTIDDWRQLPEHLRHGLEQDIQQEMHTGIAELAFLAAPGARPRYGGEE